MPAIFPELLPEELLYSAMGRYQGMMSISSRAVLRELYGAEASANAVVDLPTRIEHFLHRLPPGHSYSALAIIRKHTMLPYYSRFIEARRLTHVTAIMRGRRPGQVFLSLGLAPSTVITPTHLKYCGACRLDDQEALGTAYWHRVHQLPGVYVCPHHGNRLSSEPQHRLGYASRRLFHPPDHPPSFDESEAASSTEPRPWQLEIAQDSLWLLANWVHPIGGEALRERYRSLASARGFISRTGRVWISDLRAELVSQCGLAFLEEIGCTLSVERHDDWLSRILRAPTSGGHPLQYILVARVLGSSVQEVLEGRPQSRPVCVRFSSRDEQARLNGARRRRVEPTPEWERRLIALVADRSKSLAVIASELGVAVGTVKRDAHRLGVWRAGWKLSYSLLPPSEKLQAAGIQGSNASSSKAPPATRLECLEERRREWLDLRAAHPTLSRSELAALRPSVYSGLLRNDADWFNSHSPAKRVWSQGSTGRVNWAERDAEALGAARAAVRALLTEPSGLRRVTVSSVGAKLGLLTDLHKRDDRLPLTAAYIRRATGLLNRLERRRLYRAVMECLRERRPASAPRLARSASLGKSVREPLRRLAVSASQALVLAIEYGEQSRFGFPGGRA